MRRTIGRFGDRGASATVFIERGCVWVRTTAAGGARRLKRMGSDTGPVQRKAITWAKKYAKTREALAADPLETAPARGISLREIWTRYQRSGGEAWRDKTARAYHEYQGILEDHFGPARKIATITLDDVDTFREARRKAGKAHGQVRRQIGFLRQLMNFAEGRDLIPRNRLRAYRYVVAKDERDQRPDEYTRDELLKIAEQLAAPRHWRARGIVTLCGSLGARINAVLHLTWADVDLNAGTVTWRAAFDKTGEEGTQPLTPMAKAALTEAWDQKHETEPWVFWAVRASARSHGRPFHYNSVAWHLAEAEKRAGVEHKPGRAFHGLRRMVVGDMGDLSLAASWVRQKSLKITAGYDRVRREQLEAARDVMSEREAPLNRHQRAAGESKS